MKWTAFILLAAASAIAAACVPVSSEGTIDAVRASASSFEPLANNEKVVVIARGSYRAEDTQRCIADAMSEILGRDRVLTPDERQTSLLLEAGESDDRSLRGDYLLEQWINRHIDNYFEPNNVRYVVASKAPQIAIEQDPYFVGVGLYDAGSHYTSIETNIIDLADQSKESIEVNASASDDALITFALVGSVVTNPGDFDAACREIGLRLGVAFRSGRLKSFDKE